MCFKGKWSHINWEDRAFLKKFQEWFGQRNHCSFQAPGFYYCNLLARKINQYHGRLGCLHLNHIIIFYQISDASRCKAQHYFMYHHERKKMISRHTTNHKMHPLWLQRLLSGDGGYILESVKYGTYLLPWLLPAVRIRSETLSALLSAESSIPGIEPGTEQAPKIL